MSSLKKYKKVKYLGKGSYGAAILVELKTDPNQKFVIKEIVIGHLKESEREAAKKEADVLQQMNHSNITMYVESFVESSKLYIVMEHADGGDLSDAIKRNKSANKRWPEDEVMRIFVQICLALKHIHDKHILHRDLKSQNIFLTSKEICESRPYGQQSDMWSLGVVLYELVALELPFQAQSLPGLIHKIISSEPNWNPVTAHYSPDLVAMTKLLLAKDPSGRPSSRDTVKSSLITAHISKLLSHTIKAGRGGAEGAVLPSPAMDAEELDLNIERERSRDKERMRERERLELAAEKERKRDEEEKKRLQHIKKLKQEMKAQAAEKEQAVQDEMDRLIPGAKQNDPNTQYSEGASERSRYQENVVKASPRNYSEPDLHRSPRVISDGSDAARYSRDDRSAAAQQHVDDRQAQELRRIHQENQQLAHENRRRANGGGHLQTADNGVANPYSRVGALPGVGGAVVRPAPPIRAGAQGGPIGSFSSQGSDQGAGQRGGLFPSAVSSDPSRRPSADQNSYVALVSQRVASKQSSGVDEAVRKERAQAFKARIEAERRGGGLFGDGGARAQPDDGMTGEDRVALVKAQRERERQREAAEKEAQLRAAHEQRKADLRQMANRRGADDRNALGGQRYNNFDDASFLSEGDRERDREEELIRRRKQKEEDDEKRRQELNDAARRARQDARALKERGAPVAFNIVVNDGLSNKETPVPRLPPKVRDAEALVAQEKIPDKPPDDMQPSSSPQSSKNDGRDLQEMLPRQRRGWGPPATDLKLSPGRINVARKAEPVSHSFQVDSKTVGDDDDVSLPGWSEPANAEELREDERGIRKRLEDKEKRQKDDRENAKQIIRKLREQKRDEGAARRPLAGRPPTMAGRAIPAERLVRLFQAETAEPVRVSYSNIFLHNLRSTPFNTSIIPSITQTADVGPVSERRPSALLSAKDSDGSSLKASDGLFDLSDSEGELERTIDKYVLNKVPRGQVSRSHSSEMPQDKAVDENVTRVADDADVASLQCTLAAALLND